MSTPVALTDDNKAMRRAIVRLLQGAPEIQILADASDFARTVELASKLRPQVT